MSLRSMFSYMFMTTAAPPKRAAKPMAPVSIGRAASPLLEALDAALATAEVSRAEVGVATPDVKGTLLALVAPANPCSVVAVFGVRVLLLGLSTLSMT